MCVRVCHHGVVVITECTSTVMADDDIALVMWKEGVSVFE